MVEKKNICRAALSAEGRTAWVAAWDAAWDAANRASVSHRASDPAEGRKAWAAAIEEAINTAPPATSNATWDSAWDSAWAAAWDAAIAVAMVRLEERQMDNTTSSHESWDAGSRALRHSTGRAAGCEAWNAAYRVEVNKN